MKKTSVCLLAILQLLLHGCWDNGGSVVVSVAPQNISFAAPAPHALPAAPFAVSATSSSGLAVSFSSLTLPVCTVSGSTVTLVGAGDCTLQADQAGDAFHAPAVPVTRTFAVAAVAAPETGEVTLMSGGVQRSFYLIVPADYDASRPVKPLLVAYHGTNGSYDLWLPSESDPDGYYDLVPTVGDGAIMVLAQALPDVNGVKQWNYAYDLQYFQDVLAYVDEHLSYDKQKVFVTGHSSGGGMAHELGCKFGDRIRGIAVHAGILRSTQCVGAVAVLQTHGEYDTLVPYGTGEAGHQFWVLYNGFDYGVSTEGIRPFCIDHSLGASPYPVQWCLHQEGEGVEAHNWPSFASAATWEFFSGLAPVAESEDPPAGGGNDKVADLFDTTLSFTLVYPAGIGQVTQGSIGLYPAGTTTPSGGPDAILQLSFDPGAVGPGSTQRYEVPIKYANQTFPGTYAFAIVIYVANGGNPIPFVGRDHIVLTDVNVVDRSTKVEIVPELLLHPVGR